MTNIEDNLIESFDHRLDEIQKVSKNDKDQ